MEQNAKELSCNSLIKTKISAREKLMVLSFFLAVFVVGLDSFIISPLLAAIASDLNITTQTIGLSVTLYAVFYAAGAPIIAPLSEKASRKNMIIAGLAIFAFATFLSGFADELWMFYSARALAGLGAAVSTPNIYAYIGGNFNKEKVGKVMGIVMAALSLSIAIGVPIGSFIAGFSSWSWTFWISGIVALLSLSIILTSVKKDQSPNGVSKSIFIHYKNIITKKQALLGLFMMFFWMYSFFAIYTFLGVYIENAYALTTSGAGLVFIAYGLSNFVSSFLGGWISKPLGMKKTIILSGFACSALYLFLAVTSQSLVLFIIVLALVAFFQGLAAPQLVIHNVSVLPESRSTMTSVSNSFLYLGLTFGSAVGGWLIQDYSFWLLIVVSMASIILSVWIAKIIMK